MKLPGKRQKNKFKQSYWEFEEPKARTFNFNNGNLMSFNFDIMTYLMKPEPSKMIQIYNYPLPKVSAILMLSVGKVHHIFLDALHNDLINGVYNEMYGS